MNREFLKRKIKESGGDLKKLSDVLEVSMNSAMRELQNHDLMGEFFDERESKKIQDAFDQWRVE